jgi:membrane protease subunit HflK
VPEARGTAAQDPQDSEAYREQTVAEAKGQARVSEGLRGIQEAPEVTRQRIYLRDHGEAVQRHREDHY